MRFSFIENAPFQHFFSFTFFCLFLYIYKPKEKINQGNHPIHRPMAYTENDLYPLNDLRHDIHCFLAKTMEGKKQLFKLEGIVEPLTSCFFHLIYQDIHHANTWLTFLNTPFVEATRNVTHSAVTPPTVNPMSYVAMEIAKLVIRVGLQMTSEMYNSPTQGYIQFLTQSPSAFEDENVIIPTLCLLIHAFQPLNSHIAASNLSVAEAQEIVKRHYADNVPDSVIQNATLIASLIRNVGPNEEAIAHWRLMKPARAFLALSKTERVQLCGPFLDPYLVWLLERYGCKTLGLQANEELQKMQISQPCYLPTHYDIGDMKNALHVTTSMLAHSMEEVFAEIRHNQQAAQKPLCRITTYILNQGVQTQDQHPFAFDRVMQSMLDPLCCYLRRNQDSFAILAFIADPTLPILEMMLQQVIPECIAKRPATTDILFVLHKMFTLGISDAARMWKKKLFPEKWQEYAQMPILEKEALFGTAVQPSLSQWIEDLLAERAPTYNSEQCNYIITWLEDKIGNVGVQKAAKEWNKAQCHHAFVYFLLPHETREQHFATCDDYSDLDDFLFEIVKKRLASPNNLPHVVVYNELDRIKCDILRDGWEKAFEAWKPVHYIRQVMQMIHSDRVKYVNEGVVNSVTILCNAIDGNANSGPEVNSMITDLEEVGIQQLNGFWHFSFSEELLTQLAVALPIVKQITKTGIRSLSSLLPTKTSPFLNGYHKRYEFPEKYTSEWEQLAGPQSEVLFHFCQFLTNWDTTHTKYNTQMWPVVIARRTTNMILQTFQQGYCATIQFTKPSSKAILEISELMKRIVLIAGDIGLYGWRSVVQNRETQGGENITYLGVYDMEPYTQFPDVIHEMCQLEETALAHPHTTAFLSIPQIPVYLFGKLKGEIDLATMFQLAKYLERTPKEIKNNILKNTKPSLVRDPSRVSLDVEYLNDASVAKWVFDVSEHNKKHSRL